MIHFVLDKSKNYALVQQTLLDVVRRHLEPSQWTAAVGKRRDDALNFSLFVRQPADVVMSHGVADKNYFTDVWDPEGKLFANRLRALLVPGAWLKRKLLAFPGFTLQEHQVLTVGWPRLDLLREMHTAAVRSALVPRSSKKRLLWAPTHDFVKRGDEQLSTSSYPAFQECLPELERDFEVEVSLHPRNRPNKAPTEVALLKSDVVISDFGTLVYEAWALGKPVIFPRWLLGDRIEKYLPGSAEAHIFGDRIGYHPNSLEELLAIVRENPVVTPDVHAFMNDYLDNYRTGSSGARIATVLTSLAAQKRNQS
jgi:CDP-glycerol glycerophosphotransferase (TagB/SpsB family)